MSELPNFSAYCEQACRKLWGEPTRTTAKELRWINGGDAYSGKTFNFKKRAWYDHGAQAGGSTLELVAYTNGKPAVELRGAKFFEAWQKAHELGIVPEPPPQPEDNVWNLPIRRTHPYHDENGVLLFEVVRFDSEEKDNRFRQRRPDGRGGWIRNTKGVRRILYRLPELIEGLSQDRPILVCEGERDADTARNLGYVATTPPEGAEKLWLDAYSETLRGADVIIVSDNDAHGRGQRHAEKVARVLQGVASRVRVIMFPVKDLTEWHGCGHTREELDALIADAAAIENAPEFDASAATDATDAIGEAWHYFGEHVETVERKYLIDKLLPETGVALIAGQWGTYKTFAAIDLAAAVVTDTPFAGFNVARQGAVLLVALEGEGEVGVRLKAALAHRGHTKPLAPFAWINTCPRLLDPDAAGKLTAMVRVAAERMLRKFNLPTVLVIIDTSGKAAGYERSGDENDAVLGRQIVGAMAAASRATGALFVGIDHFGKTAETGTRGTSAKEADSDAVLALLGEKGMSGEVTNPRLAIRKRRSGANGIEISFHTTVVQAGDNETTLVIEWKGQAETSTAERAGEKKDKWAKSIRVLRFALMSTLAEHGQDCRPIEGGPIVRAVDREIIRAEFYKTYPAEGDVDVKGEARRKAFNRALKEAQAERLIGVREIGATTVVWFWVEPQSPQPGGPRYSATDDENE